MTWALLSLAVGAVAVLWQELRVREAHDARDAALAGRAFWYALAGILAVPLYEAAQAWLKRKSEQ